CITSSPAIRSDWRKRSCSLQPHASRRHVSRSAAIRLRASRKRIATWSVSSTSGARCPYRRTSNAREWCCYKRARVARVDAARSHIGLRLWRAQRRLRRRKQLPQRRSIGEAIDNQIQQSAETRQAAEVAMIADEGVACGWSLTDIDRDKAGCSVAQRAGEHREPGTSRAELGLDLPVVTAESDF